MECSVITTYRCNAKCGMCNTWKNPSKASEEFKPQILEKIPSGIQRLNITGGEPMLRKDIEEIVGILDKKTNRLEIRGPFDKKKSESPLDDLANRFMFGEKPTPFDLPISIKKISDNTKKIDEKFSDGGKYAGAIESYIQGSGESEFNKILENAIKRMK